jgi:hypothetical protein
MRGKDEVRIISGRFWWKVSPVPHTEGLRVVNNSFETCCISERKFDDDDDERHWSPCLKRRMSRSEEV